MRACVGGSCLDNDRPLPPLSSPFFTPFSPQPSSRTVNCGGNNSAEEDGYDYPARFRSPPSDFHNPSPGRGEEKAGESGGEVGGRDEYEMRSESSRRGSGGAGGEMRGEGWERIEDLLSLSLFLSPSPLFSFGLIAIRSLRGRATRFLSREKGFVCLEWDNWMGLNLFGIRSDNSIRVTRGG